MAAPVWVSRRRYARLTKCSESSIRKAIARGMIRPRASDGLINRREADETWLRWSQVGQRRTRAPTDKQQQVTTAAPERRRSIDQAIPGGLQRLHLAVTLSRSYGDDGLLWELTDALVLECDQYDALTLLAGLVLTPREAGGEGEPAVVEELVRQALRDALERISDWATGSRDEPLSYPQPAGEALTLLARRHGLEGGLYTGWALD
jgi:hypothetical protein